jgi:ABC-type nitrate/sulfonate/bicarbonate transport system permease component
MKRIINNANLKNGNGGQYNHSAGYIVPGVFMAFLLIVWEYAVIFGNIKKFILPPPSLIFRTLIDTFPIMTPHIMATLKESAIGFSLGILFSFILAFLLDEIPLVKKAVYPLIIISQTIPIISVAPLFIIWFGYGLLPKVLVVMLVCFFPILVNLLDGLAAVDKDLLNLLKSMGAGKTKIFRFVKLPSALPYFFAGLKISASYSIMGAVIGEWLGSKEGLGYFMILSQRSFLTERVFAAIIIITLLSLGVFKIVSLLERLLLPWKSIKAKEW